MNALLRKLFRRPAPPQADTPAKPAETGTPPLDDLVYAAHAFGLTADRRPGGADPVDEAAEQLRAEIARFENSGTSTPRPSGCWLCEPHKVWLDNRPCEECEQRPPFRLADKPGPR